MSEDVIKLIADSEDRAKERKAQAQAEAKALVDQARRDGEAWLDQSRKDAQARAKELLAKAEERGAQQAAAVLEQYRGRCETLRAQAGEKLPQAAELIAGKVVRD